MRPSPSPWILAALCAPLGTAWGAGFTGAYDPANWTNTPITGGTAAVDVASSDIDTLIFDYDVNLGGGGVSRRTTVVSVIATTDGELTVDWEYSYQHAWFQAQAELTFFAYDAANVRQDVVAFSGATGGGLQTSSGTIVALPIYAGRAFGFEVGGSNFDSNSILDGTVVLTNFDADDEDCNGVSGGTAVLDECGTCDDDPTNDCVQDCAGTWGGTAMPDACGGCDDDPTNDCVEDCEGTPGGTATVDMCGTCDDRPRNDCVQDCEGTWGGAAVEDRCGACDDDPTNDCVKDCAGVWGGAAAFDACGICSGGTSGNEIDMCLQEDDTPVTPVPAKSSCGCDGSGGRVTFLPLLALLGVGATRRRRTAR